MVETQKEMIIESVKAMLDNSELDSEERIFLLTRIAAIELAKQNVTKVSFTLQNYEVSLKIESGELNNA